MSSHNEIVEGLTRERDEARECSTLMERERDAARGRAADAEARIAALIDALEGLLVKMDRVQASDEYRAVWIIAHAHGQKYEGEKWDAEVNAAKAALVEAKGGVK